MVKWLKSGHFITRLTLNANDSHSRLDYISLSEETNQGRCNTFRVRLNAGEPDRGHGRKWSRGVLFLERRAPDTKLVCNRNFRAGKNRHTGNPDRLYVTQYPESFRN